MILVCDTGSYTIINVEKVKGLYLEVWQKNWNPPRHKKGRGSIGKIKL
jgi:hypothetical protein